MLRGTTTFVCDECGHKFEGLDMEWNATAASTPQKCPNCGSMHTSPSGLLALLNKGIYRKIWKHLDERNDKLRRNPLNLRSCAQNEKIFLFRLCIQKKCVPLQRICESKIGGLV